LLEIADVPGLRPTSERIRETVFNWLAPRVVEARCLDLFAGTGALGLEALSRGARSAVFIEKSRKAIEALRRNVKTLAADGAEVRQADAFEYIARFGPDSFDIVFLDPPFAADALDELCRLLDREGVPADGCLVYLEEDKSRPAVTLPDGWQMLKSKTAGNVRYSLAEVMK
jgi:16S rRNA (guanine966-N2)-methyltransferase